MLSFCHVAKSSLTMIAIFVSNTIKLLLPISQSNNKGTSDNPMHVGSSHHNAFLTAALIEFSRQNVSQYPSSEIIIILSIHYGAKLPRDLFK